MVRTSFGTDDPGVVQRFLVPFLRPFMKAPTQGAATSIHVASSPDVENRTDLYFADSRAISSSKASSSKASYDEADAARLWQVSADLVG